MNRIIIIAAIAVCCLSIVESHAQKVIKDASGAVYIDVTDMPAGSYSTTPLNKITGLNDAGNSVYKRFQIAKSNLGRTMTFAEALGISTSYNNESTSAAGLTQGSSSPCATYREGGFSGWRVPTYKELLMIFVMKDMLIEAGIGAETFNKVGIFSSTESVYYDNDNGVTRFSVYVIYFGYGTNYGPRSKGDLFTIRCVREVN